MVKGCVSPSCVKIVEIRAHLTPILQARRGSLLTKRSIIMEPRKTAKVFAVCKINDVRQQVVGMQRIFSCHH